MSLLCKTIQLYQTDFISVLSLYFVVVVVVLFIWEIKAFTGYRMNQNSSYCTWLRVVLLLATRGAVFECLFHPAAVLILNVSFIFNYSKSSGTQSMV